MNALSQFIDQLSMIEWWLLIALIGAMSFLLLGLVQLGAFYLAALIRHWRVRRELRRYYVAYTSQPEVSRLTAHVAKMRNFLGDR